jgi:LysM repeat protein
LSGIAAQYGTTANVLAQANNIANPNYVRAGQVLCVQ